MQYPTLNFLFTNKTNPVLILGYVLLLVFGNDVSAQKFVQLEKRNSLKTIRFNIGDDITFRTELGGKDWYTRTIWDVDRDQGHLSMNQTTIKLDDITFVRTYRNRSWSKSLARSLQANALTWLVFNGLDDLVYNGGNWSTAITVAATSFLISVPLEQIFKWENHNLKKRKRLRIMDISF